MRFKHLRVREFYLLNKNKGVSSIQSQDKNKFKHEGKVNNDMLNILQFEIRYKNKVPKIPNTENEIS